MAVWTVVPDSAQLPDQPIKSSEQIAIKNNITALAEGATGAPRVEDVALDVEAGLNSVYGYGISQVLGDAPLTVSASIIVARDDAGVSNSEAYILAGEIAIGQAGDIRVSSRFNETGDGNANLEFRKNGSPIATFSTSVGGAGVTRTVDTSVVVGDLIGVYIGSDRATSTGTSFDRRILANNYSPTGWQAGLNQELTWS